MCVHVSAYEEACLRSGSSRGLLGAHQSMPRPLQPHVKPKSVPHCVCVNDPGGTPTPAAPHAFPFTCLLCPGCGPVREDYAEECSRAHLLKQERRGGLWPWAQSSCSLKLPKDPKKCKYNKPRGRKLQLNQRISKFKKKAVFCIC